MEKTNNRSPTKSVTSPMGAQASCVDLQGKEVLVLGFGVSGQAAADLAHVLQADVTVMDEGREDAFSAELIQDYQRRGVRFHFGSLDPSRLANAELVILSPGIPCLSPALQGVRQRGTPIWGEIELAFRVFRSKVDIEQRTAFVAVTGTNGKSTTTAAIGHLLQENGWHIFVGGNLGIPLSRFVVDTLGAPSPFPVPDAIVLEVSSFQLETIETFAPRVAIILNITPDHLDRYREFSDYVRAKANIFLNMSASSALLLLNGADPQTPALKMMAETKGLKVEMIQNQPLDLALFPGAHNRLNLSAAAQAVMALGFRFPEVERAAKTFRPLPHRLEMLGSFAGVTFLNDSKATNVQSTLAALAALKGPIIWIVGGYEPRVESAREDFEIFKKIGLQQVKQAIVVGANKDRLARALQGFCKVQICESLGEAVALAFAASEPNDQILFSPAAKSFDRYQNYRERGEHFARLVYQVTQGQAGRLESRA